MGEAPESHKIDGTVLSLLIALENEKVSLFSPVFFLRNSDAIIASSICRNNRFRRQCTEKALSTPDLCFCRLFRIRIFFKLFELLKIT